MPKSLLTPGLVAAEDSDSEESNLAPLAETGLPVESEDQETEVDQDVYGFAITSLLRDAHPVAVGDKGTKWLRFSRLLLSMGTLFCSIGVQFSILCCTKLFVASKAAHDIKQAYNEFEIHMYGDDPDHMEVTNGHARGKREFFQPELFESMEPDRQVAICSMSFSEPFFLMLVLFIWTVTCLSEIKRACEIFALMVIYLPTPVQRCHQLAVMMRPDAEDEEERAVLRFQRHGFDPLQARGLWSIIAEQKSWNKKLDREKVVLICGLTCCSKVLVTGLVLLPRLLLTICLLWLGCRWILATMNFEEMLLNAVALQFLVNLKDLFYHVCVSARGKADLRMVRVRYRRPSVGPGAWTCCIFVFPFAWALAALVWVLVYVFFLQRVLPGFRWDIHDVCEDLIREDYSG